MKKHTHLLAAALLSGSMLTPLDRPLVFAEAGDQNAAIERLEAQVVDLVEASEGIVAKADQESREITDEEAEAIRANAAKVDKLRNQIEARKLVQPQSRGRKTTETVEAGGRIQVGATRSHPRGGFNNFGEFAQAVRMAALQPTNTDQRLRAAATTYGNEGVGAEGGFLVFPEFSQKIMTKVMAEENLLTRCTPLTTGSNSMTIPKDETTPWDTTNGIQVYWEGEGQSPAASKPAFEQSTTRLVKLTGIVPISEELLEDAVGLESWLNAKAPAKMASKINNAIVRGTGVGQPNGILNADSLITVSKETSQPANTIYFANINNMWARMYAPWRRNAVWLINQDIEPQLEAMAFDPAASSKVPVYLPPGGASDVPYARLKSRPVVPIEACSALSDLGDIILVDLSQYWALTKTQGIQMAQSIHLYFDQALTAYRFIFRMNGMPAWSSKITREQSGAQDLSWAVTLEAR